MKSFIPAEPVHPGEILQHEFLDIYEISQGALADGLKIPRRRINEICRGRRAVTAETAILLAQAFGTSPEFWMNGQALYDLAIAKKHAPNRLADSFAAVMAEGRKTMTIREAIHTSIRENRTVKITAPDVLDTQLIAFSMDYDSDAAQITPGVYDVWGWNDETPEDVYMVVQYPGY